MKKTIFKLLILFNCFLLASCAATYKPINPPSINYGAHDLQDGIELSYQYDVLRGKGDNKYANKEYKKNIKVVAVRITNFTDTTINIGRDLVFYSGSNQIFLLEPTAIKNSIKQHTPAYLPFLLLTFLNLTVTHNTPTSTSTEVYPIGLFIGPTVTAGNMAVANSANNKLLNELIDYNIFNKELKKGETTYGIIGFKEIGYNPLSVRLKK